MKELKEFLHKHHTPKTATLYLRDIQIFLREVGHAKKAKYSDMAEYVGNLRQRYESKATVNRILSAVKKYYDHLILTGQRNTQPCNWNKLRIKNKRKDIQIQDLFSSAELELLLTREERYGDLVQKNKVVMSLLVRQALVISEITALTLKDINLDAGTIYIKASSKQNKRTLELHFSQIKLFIDYLHDGRKKLLRPEIPTDRFIISKLGTPEGGESIMYLCETFKPLFPGRLLTSGKIRQSVIANLLNEKKHPLYEVMEYAGHKYPSSTERYRSPDAGEQRKLINMFHPLSRGKA